MNTKELQKVKEKLPPHYGSVISSALNSPRIDNRTVVRVFSGEITDQTIVAPVIDAALQIIMDQKKLKTKIRKALTA